MQHVSLDRRHPDRRHSALTLPAPTPLSPAARRPLPLRPTAARLPAEPGVAFGDAAQAWFWTLAALAARRDSTGSGGAGTPRPCDPDDVIRALDLLYRRGGIDLSHARVLRRWGDRGIAPDAGRSGQGADARLWAEAMERLEGLLRAKRIVG